MSDIIEEVGSVVTLKKKQDPTVDSMGVETDITYTDVTITVVVQPLNSKERERLATGNVITGMKKAYCKPTYTQGGTDYTVEPGDLIIGYDTHRYRVKGVPEDWDFGETSIYRKVLLQRVV